MREDGQYHPAIPETDAVLETASVSVVAKSVPGLRSGSGQLRQNGSSHRLQAVEIIQVEPLQHDALDACLG